MISTQWSIPQQKHCVICTAGRTGLRLSDGLWNMSGYWNTMELLTYIQGCKRNINGFFFLNTPYNDGLF